MSTPNAPAKDESGSDLAGVAAPAETREQDKKAEEVTVDITGMSTLYDARCFSSS